MWCINKKTGVKYEFTDAMYKKYHESNEDLQPIEDEPVKKTRKMLVSEAKEKGVKGADRMSIEELEKAVE
jgi:hypothetical protein